MIAFAGASQHTDSESVDSEESYRRDLDHLDTAKPMSKTVSSQRATDPTLCDAANF